MRQIDGLDDAANPLDVLGVVGHHQRVVVGVGIDRVVGRHQRPDDRQHLCRRLVAQGKGLGDRLVAARADLTRIHRRRVQLGVCFRQHDGNALAIDDRIALQAQCGEQNLIAERR